MASATHSQIVKVGEVFHHPEFNKARLSGEINEGKQKELQASMISEGWRQNGDGVLEVVKIDDSWKERAVKELTAKWDDLKAKVETDAKMQPYLHVFELNRVSKGKIIVPKYMGISGNTRDKLLPEVNTARYVAGQGVITEYPVLVREFENSMERIIAQAIENTGKLTGFSKMTEKDLILCASEIYNESKKLRGGKAQQNDIRRAFGDSTGQKLFGILTLDERFPKVKLKYRLTELKPEQKDEGFIRFSSINGPALPNLVMRSDSASLLAENRKRTTKGEAELVPLNEEGLENFLGTPRANAAKIMSKDNISGMTTEMTNSLIQATAKAVLDNDKDPLKRFEAHAMVYNAVDSLCTVGLGPDLDVILTAITKAQDPNVAVKSVKHALKV